MVPFASWHLGNVLNRETFVLPTTSLLLTQSLFLRKGLTTFFHREGIELGSLLTVLRRQTLQTLNQKGLGLDF